MTAASISREGKCHRVALAKFRHERRGPCPRKSELPFGWINALNLHRGASLDQSLGEGPVAAADVDPSQTRKRRQPIEENLTD